MSTKQSLTYVIRWFYDRFATGLNEDGSSFTPGGNFGTPVAGVLAATTSAAALSSTLPCKGVYVFIAAGNQDTLVGDATSQPCLLPAIGMFFPVNNVNKLFAKLSANTADIPWLAIT